jgi:hypothetical protein
VGLAQLPDFEKVRIANMIHNREDGMDYSHDINFYRE